MRGMSLRHQALERSRDQVFVGVKMDWAETPHKWHFAKVPTMPASDSLTVNEQYIRI